MSSADARAAAIFFPHFCFLLRGRRALSFQGPEDDARVVALDVLCTMASKPWFPFLLLVQSVLPSLVKLASDGSFKASEGSRRWGPVLGLKPREHNCCRSAGRWRSAWRPQSSPCATLAPRRRCSRRRSSRCSLPSWAFARTLCGASARRVLTAGTLLHAAHMF